MKSNRRRFLGSAAMVGVAATGKGRAAETTTAAKAAAPKDATLQLARYALSARYQDLPAPVRKEAVRTLVNYIGCAVGGARHETVDNAIAALAPFAGTGQATILGRKERLDVLNASLMNGISSHVLDYDDTHLRTIIHPAGPVASAILALAEYKPVSGTDFLNALVVGIEVECRIGNAVYPAHYDTGWHITGTVGPFGAAAAAGKLLALSEQQMVWALGLAAVQPVGLREMFGSMTKSFHPGRAAQNGLTAALLAQKNYTSSDHGLEAKSGWLNVLSTEQKWGEIVDNLGKSWEVSVNTYKPFACGIVLHPTIDACIQLRNEAKLKADQIQSIELKVHPLVLELTGKRAPKTGLESKFSVYHAAAAAIVTGMGGDKQFSDQLALDPIVSALASRVTATVTPGIAEDQVKVTVTLKDGRRLEKQIDHAVGSVKNPMSDKALEGKFLDLANGVLPVAQAKRLLELSWKIETLQSAADIAKAAQA